MLEVIQAVVKIVDPNGNMIPVNNTQARRFIQHLPQASGTLPAAWKVDAGTMKIDEVDYYVEFRELDLRLTEMYRSTILLPLLTQCATPLCRLSCHGCLSCLS